MARAVWVAGAVAVGGAGCASTPPLDNPALIRPAVEDVENPVLVSPGAPTPASYREVFEKCIDVLDDDYEIRSANMADGRILTLSRIAPGYEQPWKTGNPDPRERLLATLQSVRQTALVEIRVGERGGYLVAVVVERELEDVARPSRQQAGGAVFQEAPTVDRQLDVVGPAPVAPVGGNWFPIGRDYAAEQRILRRIRECR